jgi:hypothetical protein
MDKTLYLWDLEGTLFLQSWNKDTTGFDSFEDYAKANGLKINSGKDFEEAYVNIYENGDMVNLRLADGFEEVLNFTKNNETFSSGMQAQMLARVKYFKKKLGADILKYFRKLNSTFDYSDSNIKTKEMLIDYLKSKYDEGFKTVVYTDDKVVNCVFFEQSAVYAKSLFGDFNFRIYHLKNDNSGLSQNSWYYEIGKLSDLLDNEKNL